MVEIKKEKTETVDVCHKLYLTTRTKIRYDFFFIVHLKEPFLPIASFGSHLLEYDNGRWSKCFNAQSVSVSIKDGIYTRDVSCRWKPRRKNGSMQQWRAPHRQLCFIGLGSIH